MKSTIKILITCAVLVAAGLLFYELSLQKSVPGQFPERQQLKPVVTQIESLADEPLRKDDLPPGVNPKFYDEPHMQVGWMNRAVDVLNNNLPDFATSAEVRNVFFHRGFKGWAVACGEVQLYREGELVQDYQRFVFPGVQTIYFENDIKNFQIYWDKACVQISEEGLRQGLSH